VFLCSHGERHDLWCAVDQYGHILDILVQRQRDNKAAKQFFHKLLKWLTYVPRVIIDDPELPGVAGDHRRDHGRVRDE
jgi:transposase-like protein